MFKKSKKYISLKEAARMSGYSSDYIGWLIRKRKIKGEKVYTNTVWQVSASEIIKYCKKKNLGVRDSFWLKKKYLSLKEAAELSGYAPDYIGYLIRKGEITGKKVDSGTAWMTTEEAMKKYQEKFENRKQKGKINQGVKLIYDIFPPETVKEVVKEITGWKPYKNRSAKIFGIGWRFALATAVFLLLIGVGPVEIFQKIVGAFTEEEKTINFYSTVCLGGWENPQNAQGEPDLIEGAEAGEFNEQNSAVLRNSISQIFCEGFEGDIPDDTEIERVSLKFSWVFKKENLDVIIPAPVPPEETPLPEEIPPAEKEPEPAIEPEPSPEIPPAPSPENNEESLSPSASSWKKNISLAFAQEDNQNNQEEPNSEEPTSQEPEEEPVSPPPAPPPIENIASDALLEVFYTLDSVDWQSLGKVGHNNWQDLTLEVPISSWEDLKNLQISLQSLMVFGDPPTIYLDSVWIEVETGTEIENLPEVGELDLSMDKIKEIKSISPEKVIVRIEKENKNELWLFNLESGKIRKMGFQKSAPTNDFRIGLKGNSVFWLNERKDTVFAYDLARKKIYQKALPLFDPSKGERARVKFPKLSWEVIVDADNFYFFSKDAGEIFSDGNSEVLESFRREFNLDNSLTKEELRDIGFSVEESVEENE